MLICDWCQGGVHLCCHQPALTELPEGEEDWFCHKCTPIVAKQRVAREILQKHEKACKSTCVSAADKVNAMADLLAGVGVEGDSTMCTGAMSAAGDADDYTCVTSPCKTAPGVERADASSKVC
jgi:hypothetical protein